MNSAPAPTLTSHVWTIAQVMAVVVTIISFAPETWFAALSGAVALQDAAGASLLSAFDYRLLVIGIGVSLISAAIIGSQRIGHKQASALASAPTPAAIDSKLSIAVLPFVNMSSDPEKEYLADGMTEDIITGLSCDSRLFVIARNSTFAYKGSSPDIRAVGHELGVRYVLEGSIRPVGERLRITMQLVETETGTHVWSDKIDRPEAELFAIMDEVVDGLVTTLCSNLGIAEAKRAARQHPEKLQAWALCVQAEAFSLQTGAEAFAQEEALLRQATTIEPGYALGWALLAKLTSSQIARQTGTERAKSKHDALSYAEKALVLAPHDPVVLGYCGFVFIVAGKTERGVDCLERSLGLNPNSGKFRLYYGFALWADGRPKAGIAQLDQFLRLSPKDPHLGLAYSYYSSCYLALDDFQQAEQCARKSLKLLPGFPPGFVNLVLALTAQGLTEEAQQQIIAMQPSSSSWTHRHIDEFWREMLKEPEQAEKLIALARKAWPDMAQR